MGCYADLRTKYGQATELLAPEKGIDEGLNVGNNLNKEIKFQSREILVC